MPDYNFTVKVPADTSKEDPLVKECVLTKGMLAGGVIYFPRGCAGMVHVIICDGQGQLYPANAEDTFHGDGYPVPLVGRHVLDSSPYKLYIRAWSPGTKYDHSIQVKLNVLSEEELMPMKEIARLLTEIVRRLFGI